jgi:hypothetical protein
LCTFQTWNGTTASIPHRQAYVTKPLAAEGQFPLILLDFA